MNKTFKKWDPITPREAQSFALREGYRGAGFVSPNPMVGCVIVDHQHRFLASGYHAKYGEAHAEVMALNQVTTEELKGGTMYVTLEPCSHHGKTPPCADRVASEPLARVVVGCKDPNPLVAGRGIEILKKKNIKVDFDSEFTQKSQRLAEIFLWNMTHQLPFITLKFASSLDGKIALKSGESQWITSEASRKLARTLRAHHVATLIGARTLLKDNPVLDFRDTAFEGKKKNKIIIYDPRGTSNEVLAQSKLLKTHGKENIFLLTSNPERSLNAQQFQLDDAGGITVPALQWLYQQKIFSIYVEGGGYTFSQFLQNGSFQKIYQFLAPDILGQGIGWTDFLNIQNMGDKLRLKISKVHKVDRDLMLVAYPK